MKKTAAATKTLRNKISRLRSLLWYMLVNQKCVFCGKKFSHKEIRDGMVTVHHSSGTKVKRTPYGIKVYRVHKDLELSHPSCHKSYEMKRLRKQFEDRKWEYKRLRAKGWSDEKIWRMQKKRWRRVPKGTPWGG